MMVIDTNCYTDMPLTKYDPFNVDEQVIFIGGKVGRIDHSRVEQENRSVHPYGSDNIAMPPPSSVGFIKFILCSLIYEIMFCEH